MFHKPPSGSTGALTPREAAFVSLLNALPGDEIAQSQLITALILSMWQLSGAAFSHSAPSFLLVNGGHVENPMFRALSKLVGAQLGTALTKPKPLEVAHSWDLNGFRGNPDLSRKTMRAAIATRRTLEREITDREVVLEKLNPWPLQWRRAKAELFPALQVRRYRAAHDPHFGVVTGEDDYISMLIYGTPDRDALRKDLRKNPGRLNAPAGYSNELEEVCKHLSLMGSVPLEEWDAELVDRSIALQKPVYFLPHFQQESIELVHMEHLQGVIGLFNHLHRLQAGQHVVDPLATPSSVELDRYENLIGRLSASLPGNREFPNRVIIRQASGVIYRLVTMIEPSKHNSPVLQAIAADLYRSFLRGIAYSLASLKYHAYSLGLGNHRPTAAQCLGEIRARDGIERRHLQRKVYTIKAELRDQLLGRLEHAGLILADGKAVKSVTLVDFLLKVRERERFPDHSLITAQLVGESRRV